MPRRVIEGSPGNLVDVSPADLSGTRHDFSYFRHVRLTGDWAGHSLRYVDLIGGRCDADLSNADDITGLSTYRTDTEGVTLTAEQADHCDAELAHGYVMDRGRTYMADVLSQPQNIIDEITKFDQKWALGDSTTRSWKKLMVYWMQTMGITAAQMRALLRHVYSDLPKLLSLMEQTETANPHVLRIFAGLDPSAAWTTIPESDFSQPMLNAIQRRDRWRLARAAEQHIATPIAALCRLMFPVWDFAGVTRAVIADPEAHGVYGIEGDTPAERLRDMMIKPGPTLAPRPC